MSVAKNARRPRKEETQLWDEKKAGGAPQPSGAHTIQRAHLARSVERAQRRTAGGGHGSRRNVVQRLGVAREGRRSGDAGEVWSHLQGGRRQGHGDVAPREEGVLQDGLGRGPLQRVAVEGHADEVLGLLRKASGGGDAIVVVLYLAVRRLDVARLKRRLANQHGIEDAADGPNVHLKAVAALSPIQNLGGNVVGRAAQRSG